jgi:hypothetical protein
MRLVEEVDIGAGAPNEIARRRTAGFTDSQLYLFLLEVAPSAP